MVMFRGHLEGRQVLVNPWTSETFPFTSDMAIRDIVIASHMSRLKNVLKLVGCCLESGRPTSVYDYAGGILLYDLLDPSRNGRLLSWRSRIKIATDIARTVVYLHTAFPTPVIYRNLKPLKVIIDQYGVAKLYDFSLCISLPPGELFVVEDNVIGTPAFIDSDYSSKGYVSQKTDVYSFGVLLLMLLTGKPGSELEGGLLLEYVKHYPECEQLIDPRMLEQEGGVGTENSFESFLDLALSCTRENGEERPDMIDVAKQLRVVKKGIFHPLPKTTDNEQSGVN